MLVVFAMAPEAWCGVLLLLGAVLWAGAREVALWTRGHIGRLRHRRNAWPRVLSIVMACLTGCATFGQKPQPVGEPGPIACIGAQSAILSWEELDRYMRAVLEAQQVYSCGPVAPSLAPTAPAVPALR
jgi:hypothetical protein